MAPSVSNSKLKPCLGIHFYIFLEHSEENRFTTNDWFFKILFSDRIQVLLRFSTPLRSALPKQRHRRKRKFYKSTTFCNSGLKFWTVRGLKSEKIGKNPVKSRLPPLFVFLKKEEVQILGCQINSSNLRKRKKVLTWKMKNYQRP